MTDETTTTATAPAPAADAAAPAAGAAVAEGVTRVSRRLTPPRKPRGRTVAPANDPVGDMLTRVRNAVGARHETVSLPTSKIKVEIARILKAEGFIGGYSVEPGRKGEDGERASAAQLVVRLKYVGGKVPAVSGLRRISRPGLRVYARKTEMPRVLGGLGIAIVSTSSGLMTGREAERKGLGGEVLAYVW